MLLNYAQLNGALWDRLGRWGNSVYRELAVNLGAEGLNFLILHFLPLGKFLSLVISRFIHNA
jgi:hypothetical protein